ncbi:MAG TPA: STING domain-containing protein [Opitutaceae bacterium]|nr:STING domain-containing protein [Opitutaceae bacterium]
MATPVGPGRSPQSKRGNDNTMWEETAINLGLRAVERFFEKTGRVETEPVSIGLAVGYHYNFLAPIAETLEGGSFVLYETAEGGNGRPFAEALVSVQLIIPNRLDAECFRSCEAEFQSLRRGWSYLPRNRRFYGFNYTLTGSGGGAELALVDLVRPLMAAKRYYEEIVRMDTTADPARWNRIQKTEITAFKETLRQLQRRGGGILANRLDFRERS